MDVLHHTQHTQPCEVREKLQPHKVRGDTFFAWPRWRAQVRHAWQPRLSRASVAVLCSALPLFCESNPIFDELSTANGTAA